jgi:mannose-1-phosphate guanylyltransferase
MRHALILAGGSGTRLWPMSRVNLPKQLIPFIDGRSLLELAYERLDALVAPDRWYVCAAEQHRDVIRRALPSLTDARFLGEPVGRDTLNAVALSAAVIAQQDLEAVIAVFPADQIIQPKDAFQRFITRGFEAVEAAPQTVVTFGVTPSGPSTAYGYLELGEPIADELFRVSQFREKPDAATAARYLAAGPQRYLWNSGIFLWRASTLLDCVRRYEPATYEGLRQVAEAWSGRKQAETLARIYPTLKKISVDFAVMEPASRDPVVRIAAVPMALEWLDVGSWPMFARTCSRDSQGNAIALRKSLLVDTSNALVASSEPGHLIATIGCQDLIIIHTKDATLVCRADRAEKIKELYHQLGERFGEEYL